MTEFKTGNFWFRIWSLYLAALSTLIRGARRREWYDEWTGELWQLLMCPSHGEKARRGSLTSFLWGAARHARWVRCRVQRASVHAGQLQDNTITGNWISAVTAPVGQDIRYAARQILKRPTLALVVCSTLALGIGANTALFSVLYGVLLRPLPYSNADEVVTIWWQNTELGWTHNALTAPDFRDIQAQNETFAAIGAFQRLPATTLSGTEPHRVEAHAVTPEVLQITAVPPLLGRIFLPDDDVPGAPYTAVISHGLWQREFGESADVIGHSLKLNWGDFTVIGVMPREFRWLVGGEPQLWLPLQLTERQESDRRNHYLSCVGRVRPGVELPQADADLSAIAARLEQEYPESNNATAVTVETMTTTIVGEVRFTLWLILGAAAVILLIACANVASLYLSQCLARRQEMAVRASLGAGRPRQIRQLFVESLSLALVGGIGGLLLAHVGVRLFLAFEPGNIPRTDGIATNAPVLLFCLSTTVLTSVFFGVVPAILATRSDLTTALKDADRGSSTKRSSMRVKNGLAVLQMATAIVLLVGAGLLGRSFSQLRQVDPGFEAANVLTVEIPQGGSRYHDAADRVRFQDELLARLEDQPHVRRAGAVTSPPFSLAPQIWMIPSGRESDSDHSVLSRLYVSPGYFDVLGLSIIAGRLPNGQDRHGTPHVVVINEAAARLHWPDENPIGQTFHLGLPDSPLLEIIGVVSDMRQYGVRYRPYPAAFVPYAQEPAGDYDLLLKTQDDPLAAVAALRSLVHDMDPDMALGRIQTLENTVSANVASSRFLMLLASAFALIAIALAAAGIYGVLAYAVSSRTQEIGIKMALGARKEQVLRSVLYQGVKLAVVALLLGLPLAYLLSRMMRNLLFEIGSADPITFTGIAGFVLTVTLAACYFPAAGAAGSDPIRALRIE